MICDGCRGPQTSLRRGQVHPACGSNGARRVHPRDLAAEPWPRVADRCLRKRPVCRQGENSGGAHRINWDEFHCFLCPVHRRHRRAVRGKRGNDGVLFPGAAAASEAGRAGGRRGELRGACASGLFGVGCAACGTFVLSPVLSFVGASGLIALLPFGGEEFGALGVAMLAFSLVLTARKIGEPLACPLGPPDKTGHRHPSRRPAGLFRALSIGLGAPKSSRRSNRR